MPASADTGNLATGNYARFNNYELNGHYAPDPGPEPGRRVHVHDARLDGEKPSFHQFSLQTAYSLSKRTDVYLQGEYVHARDLGGTALAPRSTA